MTARRHLVLTALAAATALALPMGSALAQNYPSRTISLIVSFPPGGEPAALAKINAYHNERYGKVIREAGIMAD